jgi:hypothetical protein
MRQHLATPHLLPLRPGTALEDIGRNAGPAMEEARDYLGEIAPDESSLRGSTVLIVEGTPLLPFLMARRGARVTVSTRSGRYAAFLSGCATRQRVEDAVAIVKGPFEDAGARGPYDRVMGSAALYTPQVVPVLAALRAMTASELHLFWPESAPPQIRFLSAQWPGVHGAPYVDPPYASALADLLQSLGYSFTLSRADVAEPVIYPTIGDAVADCAARMGGVDTRGESHLRRALRTSLTMQSEGLRFRGTYRRAHIVIGARGHDA